ncbi:thiamin pyrophosphokinase 1 [Aspergillus udagawae]|uniref:Thiamine pyrophosphokinase n=1 Tax=Aspergillus udagawae TaxID=91492 RepID=A0A8H3P833_9EURO|nr:thiamin pyrophosphokinase 1 [Aspergillus udagawae]
MSTEWDPTQFFCDSSEAIAPFALLVLNQPINERAFAVLKKHACFTICADGGANRFYDMMHKQGRESQELPNMIIGDLDSIRPSVRSYYEGLGVPVLEDPDQYSTDFTKCLKYLRAQAAEIIAKREISTLSPSAQLEILIMGGLGGRVDQAFSQIHHLYMMTREVAGEPAMGDLYLVSEESITFILQSGRHTIRTPRTKRPGVYPKQAEEEYYMLEENVGIIPLSGPARITTRGFEWDVKDWLTEIGGQISTSNHIRADEVTVDTGVPVLFTLELAQRFKRMR